jgi:hypothetical protein
VREETRWRGRGELELQSRFYAGEFGLAWRGEDGEAIEVVHLGQWNREPGPDFVGATVRVDGVEKKGDIELDREVADWERHGHAQNRAFADVVLHVFFARGRRRFFTRTCRHDAVVQVRLGAARERLASAADCGERGAAMRPADVDALVDAAARFRLARKREGWLRAEALHGRAEAMFQYLACGLGYKTNGIPFLLVAQRVGLERARTGVGEALLFGVAGFLDALRFDAADGDSRVYARRLWDSWWAMRGSEARLTLPADAWTFAAVRPQNHPHRRMGALAAIASCIEQFEQASSAPAFLAALGRLHHDFWESRASLDGMPLRGRVALVGVQRAADLAANTYAPTLEGGQGIAALREIRAGSPSGKVRRALAWLGIEATHAASLTATALGQQGLLQLYDDFAPRPPAEILALIEREDDAG